MSKRTILVVTGTRAEYGLLKPIMREITAHPALRLSVLVTGQHTLKTYGNTLKEIRRDHQPIAEVIPIRASDDMVAALSRELVGMNRVLARLRPDLVLVLGDRDEPFAAAVAAGHLGIPVAHLHGGEQTGAVVDSMIRHAITKFAHLHFPATEESRRRITRLGEEPWRVHTVGAVGLDQLPRALPSKAQLAATRGLDARQPWFLVSHHPTPLDAPPIASQIRPFISILKELSGEKIVLYPNADTGSGTFIKAIRSLDGERGFHVIRHLPRETYLAALKASDVLIGNSSSGIIEAAHFHVPVVNVGNRQGDRERGRNVIDCGYEAESIRRAISQARSSAFVPCVRDPRSPYGKGGASRKIVRLIAKLIRRPNLLTKAPF